MIVAEVAVTLIWPRALKSQSEISSETAVQKINYRTPIESVPNQINLEMYAIFNASCLQPDYKSGIENRLILSEIAGIAATTFRHDCFLFVVICASTEGTDAFGTTIGAGVYALG